MQEKQHKKTISNILFLSFYIEDGWETFGVLPFHMKCSINVCSRCFVMNFLGSEKFVKFCQTIKLPTNLHLGAWERTVFQHCFCPAPTWNQCGTNQPETCNQPGMVLPPTWQEPCTSQTRSCHQHGIRNLAPTRQDNITHMTVTQTRWDLDSICSDISKTVFFLRLDHFWL